ncbi:MAG: hypothetical protein HIU82_17360 [Proteobacteria bacterium]|nr:hypothetical protein [Pseudomonadota bacterium]
MARDRLVLWVPVAMGVGVLVYFALRFEPPGWLGASVAAGLMSRRAAPRRDRRSAETSTGVGRCAPPQLS